MLRTHEIWSVIVCDGLAFSVNQRYLTTHDQKKQPKCLDGAVGGLGGGRGSGDSLSFDFCHATSTRTDLWRQRHARNLVTSLSTGQEMTSRTTFDVDSIRHIGILLAVATAPRELPYRPLFKLVQHKTWIKQRSQCVVCNTVPNRFQLMKLPTAPDRQKKWISTFRHHEPLILEVFACHAHTRSPRYINMLTGKQSGHV